MTQPSSAYSHDPQIGHTMADSMVDETVEQLLGIRDELAKVQGVFCEVEKKVLVMEERDRAAVDSLLAQIHSSVTISAGAATADGLCQWHQQQSQFLNRQVAAAVLVVTAEQEAKISCLIEQMESMLADVPMHSSHLALAQSLQDLLAMAGHLHLHLHSLHSRLPVVI